MPASRGVTAAVVAVLLVWSVAFGGGYTLAAFSSAANVTVSFETAENFSVAEPAADIPDAARAPDGDNGSDPSVAADLGPPANDSLPVERTRSPPGGGVVPPPAART